MTGIPSRFKQSDKADEGGRFLQTLSSADRVVVLGETHAHIEPKRFFISNMERLKEMGFTHIGLEYFTTDMQPVLDEYSKTGKCLDIIEKRYKREWGRRARHETISLLRTARAHGIKIVALDDPERENESGKENQFQQDMIWRRRNMTMARTIRNLALKGDHFRIICLVGGYHASGQITHYIPQLQSRQFQFADGKPQPPRAWHRDHGHRLELMPPHSLRGMTPSP